MKRLVLFFIFITAQIFISLAAGYIILDRLTPPETGSVAEVIMDISENEIAGGLARFTYKDTAFVFRHSEIGLRADYSHIGPDLSVKKSPRYIHNLFTAFLRDYGAAPSPIYNADAEAFRNKLEQIKSFIDEQPVNADVEYAPDGTISRIYAIDGVYFDVDARFNIIYDMYVSAPFNPLAIDSDEMRAEGVLVVAYPQIQDALLDGVDTPLAVVSAGIPDGYDITIIELAAEAINKVWAPRKAMAHSPFSFGRYMANAGLDPGAQPRELSFTASVLFHALLAGGVDLSDMDFERAGDETAYPELPGYAVDIASDFQFINTLDENIVIFTNIADGMLNVIIAGSTRYLGDGAAPYEIYSRIEGGGAVLYRSGAVISG